MKVFISWSGDLSGSVAQALREWLPNVIQAIEPWMSTEDIGKGARWSAEIAAELNDTKVGILCVTRDNLESPWLNFEAGALSKTIDRTFVCPYLVGLKPSDLRGPLVQFQATEATQPDTRKLVGTLNRALGDDALTENQVDKAFSFLWPELEKALGDLKKRVVPSKPDRPQKEILEEILETVRELTRRYSVDSRHLQTPAAGARFAVPTLSHLPSFGDTPSFDGLPSKHAPDVPWGPPRLTASPLPLLRPPGSKPGPDSP